MDCRKYGYAGSSRGTTLFEAMIEPRLDNRPCGGKYGDIVQAIGHTPLVELKRLSPKPGVRIYAKLESYNPTGSVKDRVARAMIDQAEAEGAIRPGQTSLEPTSDNTGGTLMGNARRLKEEDPTTLIVAAEPLQGENVQGLRSLDDGYIPPIIDLALLDRKIFVSNRDAVVWTKKLLAEEGLFTGVSAGAIAYIATRVAADLDEGNVVFVVPDDGWKYLSSGVYTKPLEELEATLESASFW